MEEDGMKVLVTGGAGHIGSHIVERLLARGDEVLVIDNYQTGRRDNLQEHENLKIVEDSIANTEKVFEVFEEFQPEILVHAAASYKNPENWQAQGLPHPQGFHCPSSSFPPPIRRPI